VAVAAIADKKWRPGFSKQSKEKNGDITEDIRRWRTK
jgi:hypothetical protein